MTSAFALRGKCFPRPSYRQFSRPLDGLDLGPDDYLTKPFAPGELLMDHQFISIGPLMPLGALLGSALQPTTN